MDVEQRDVFFNGEQSLEPVGEHSRRRHDQDRLAAFGGLEVADLCGEGLFEGLEGPMHHGQAGLHYSSVAILLTYPPWPFPRPLRRDSATFCPTKSPPGPGPSRRSRA